MTNDNPTPQERIAPADYATDAENLDGDWESVGRKAVATLLDAALADLTMETELATDDVRRGEAVTIDHVSRLRRTLDALEFAIEGHLAVLADDAEPWEVSTHESADAERPRVTQARCDRCRDAPADRSAPER